MKKLLYSAAVFALAFLAGSCQRENLEPVVDNGTVTYTVQVPGAIATKADDGVNNVDKLVYEVYRTSGEKVTAFSDVDNCLYHREAEVKNGKAEIDLEFVNDQNFTVLFWAYDSSTNVYDVTDLTNVTVAPTTAANTHETAAFTGVDFVINCVSEKGGNVTLNRPVAQLNIATTPESLKMDDTDITVSESYVKVYGLSTSFNVAKQDAGDATGNVTYTQAAVLGGTVKVGSKDYHNLAMNYLGFIPSDGVNVKVDYLLKTSEGDINRTIDNVPVKPDFRTNIVGNLISGTQDYNVTLDADWGGVEEVEVWDGKFLSQPAFDDATSTWSVKKASELAWLAAAVNGEVAVTKAATEETFKNQTFVLTADIDLGNYTWTPIGLNGDKGGFQGTFDGKGHTISNLYVDLTAEPKYQSAGLFGSARYATIKDFTIKNATIKNLDVSGASSNGAAVLVGSAQFASTIDNVHVVNAVVTSNRRTAGIAGYFVGTIQNCSVDGLTATATPDDYDGDGKHSNGDKVGGILATTNGATVLKNNVVKNANIKGYRNLGGLAGAADLGENSSNKVENTVVTVVRTYVMDENDAALSGPIVGRILGGTLADSNVATDVVVISTEEDVETPQSFAEALANVADGGVVAVSGEISTTSLNAAGKNVTIVGTTEDAVINSSADRLTTSGNITFKNVTLTLPTTGDYFKGHDMSGGTLVFDNCKFVGCVCVMNANVTYNNCEFTNPDKYAAWVYSGKATYNNCTFTGPDRAVKVYAENANAPEVYYNNCTFRALTAADDNKTAVEVDCKTRTSGTPYYVEINNPIIENMGIAEHNAIGDRVCNLETNGVGLGIVNLNGKSYSVAHTAAQLQALAWAVKEEMGVTTVEVADGTYSDDITLTVAAAGKTAGGNLVFKAAEGASPVIAGTVTLGYFENRVGAAKWDQHITFEGITFDHKNPLTHSLSIQNLDGLKLKDCTLVGDGEYGISAPGSNPTGQSYIVNSTFVNAGLQLGGNFATGLIIDNCSFDESCINVQGGNSVTIQNCDFANTLTSANLGESFYLVRSNATPITVKNCTIDIDSELTEVATAQDKWGILWNRKQLDWTVENVAVTMTDAALMQTELLVTKCTSTGKINTTNLTVNGNVQ